MLPILALLTACCLPSGQDTTTTTTTPTPAPTPEPPPPPPPAYPRANGADYSGQWLIILASNKELGQKPEGASLLEASDIEHQLVTLDSSQFKALMPCYEVVVARSFADRKAAIAYSRQLTAAGIDNYPKNAGDYVGVQPGVEAYCAGERAEVAAACPGQVRMITQVDGRSWAHLGLDPALEEPLLASAPAPKALDESKSAWESPLSVEHAGPWKKGQAVAVRGPGSAQECTITGFSALILGQPHFGWYEYSDDQSTPGCGSPEVYAQLSCEGGVLMAPAGGQEPLVYEDMGEDPSQLPAILAKLEGLDDLRAEAAPDVEGGMPLEEHTVMVHEAEGRRVASVHLDFRSGDDYWCGGPDVRTEAVALVDLGSGEVLLQPSRVFEVNGVMVVDVDDDGTPELMLDHFPSVTTILGAGGQVCEISQEYCDCAC